MDNLKSWEKTGLLEGIDVSRKAGVADCLGAQLSINENADTTPAFKRCSIPLVRRVLPNTKNQFESFGSPGETNVHVFKTKWIKTDPTLDAEADQVLNVSKALIEEINEMFADQAGATINFYGFGFRNPSDILMYFN